MHLPVAPACNIQCGYCNRKFSCANESRPGVTAEVVSPEEASDLAAKAIATLPHISVAGIAGPGDPLANAAASLQTLALIRAKLPHLHLCLSTNGLALPEHIAVLADLGVKFITVTVNAVDPQIGAQIYRYVSTTEGRLSGPEGAACLLERQLEGIARAKEAGMTVKINMVIVQGINDQHAPAVAARMAALRADIMNCIPMAKVEGTPLAAMGEPDKEIMRKIRKIAGQWLPQMAYCGRCRADALGLLGESRTLLDMRQRKS